MMASGSPNFWIVSGGGATGKVPREGVCNRLRFGKILSKVLTIDIQTLERGSWTVVIFKTSYKVSHEIRVQLYYLKLTL